MSRTSNTIKLSADQCLHVPASNNDNFHVTRNTKKFNFFAFLLSHSWERRTARKLAPEQFGERARTRRIQRGRVLISSAPFTRSSPVLLFPSVPLPRRRGRVGGHRRVRSSTACSFFLWSRFTQYSRDFAAVLLLLLISSSRFFFLLFHCRVVLILRNSRSIGHERRSSALMLAREIRRSSAAMRTRTKTTSGPAARLSREPQLPRGGARMRPS